MWTHTDTQKGYITTEYFVSKKKNKRGGDWQYKCYQCLKDFFQGLNCLSFLGTIFSPNSPVLHPLKGDFFFSFCCLFKRKTPPIVRKLLCLTFGIILFSIHLLLKTTLKLEHDYSFEVCNSPLLSAAVVYY